MRAIHVVAGLSEADGGPSRVLPELWAQQGLAGIRVTALSTTEPGDECEAKNVQSPYNLKFYPREWPLGLKRSPKLAEALLENLSKADLCHNHGCWLYPNWVAGSVSHRLHKPFVISPLGHLDPWSLAHHPWRKKLVRFLVEKRQWKRACAFVAKSSMEADGISKLHLKARVEVIPNGIDVNLWGVGGAPSLFLEKFPVLKGQRVLLFLSRIHPKKGLDLLLHVWRKIKSSRPEWRLVVAGTGDPVYMETVKEEVKKNGLQETVLFTGPLEGEEKRSALEVAELLVLPSHSENFGQVILEALASGCPVVTTKGCPWDGLLANGCGWWIELEELTLLEALREAMARPATELSEMGSLGKAWVVREFDWKIIAQRHLELYQELVGE